MDFLVVPTTYSIGNLKMTEGSLQHLIENKHLEMRGIFNRAALLSLPVEVNYAKNFANH